MSTTTVDLKQLLAGAQLPALPQSAIRLLELSQDPDNGPPEFALPIEADPGLTGQVLRFVNSSYFGFSREISSVRLAITLVGVRTIKNFALWSAVFSLMPNPKCGPFDLKNLWQDSLRRGLFARAMGKALGMKDAEDLFAAALLQDMAVPLLAKELPDEYNDLLEARASGEKRLSDLEQERFSWTHADAAAQMAHSWSLPEEFAALIEMHAKLEEAAEVAHEQPAPFAVALSSLLPVAADDQWYDQARFVEVFEKSNPSETLTEIFRTVDEQFADFGPVLKVSTSGKQLTEYLQERRLPSKQPVTRTPHKPDCFDAAIASSGVFYVLVPCKHPGPARCNASGLHCPHDPSRHFFVANSSYANGCAAPVAFPVGHLAGARYNSDSLLIIVVHSSSSARNAKVARYSRNRRQQLLREAEGYLDLATVLAGHCDLDAAIRDRLAQRALLQIDAAREVGGDSSQAMYLEGEAHRTMRRWREAIVSLEQARAENNTNIHVHLALAWCYKRAGELDLSIEVLEEALTVDPTEAILYYNLACYWSLAGNVQLACSFLSEAFDLDPDYRDLVGSEEDFNAIRNHPAFVNLTSVIV